MDFIIASFRNRTETLMLKDYMSSRKIMCQVISTPKEANVGCGISVKFLRDSLNIVRSIIANNHFSAFAGFFSIQENTGKKVIKTV